MTNFTENHCVSEKHSTIYRFAIGTFRFSVITLSEFTWGKNAEVFQTDEVSSSVSFAYEISFVEEFEPIWGKVIYADSKMMVMKGDNKEYRVYYPGGQREPFAAAYQIAEQEMRILIDKRFSTVLGGNQTLLSMMALEHICLDADAFVLHAAYIVYEKQAIIFIAPSGGGKSTQAQLWQQYEYAVIVNDDRTFISEFEEQWIACGSPVLGSSEYCLNMCCPIKAVICLEKAGENCLERLSGTQAFQKIYEQSIVNTWRIDDIRKVAGYISHLIGNVPVYRYYCKKEKAAVEVLKEHLFED